MQELVHRSGTLRHKCRSLLCTLCVLALRRFLVDSSGSPSHFLVFPSSTGVDRRYRISPRRLASPSTSPTSTTKPVSPSSTRNGTPPTRVATTGLPTAMASAIAIGLVSCPDGSASNAHLRYSFQEACSGLPSRETLHLPVSHAYRSMPVSSVDIQPRASRLRCVEIRTAVVLSLSAKPSPNREGVFGESPPPNRAPYLFRLRSRHRRTSRRWHCPCRATSPSASGRNTAQDIGLVGYVRCVS